MRAFFYNKNHRINDIISIIPIKGDAKGITLENLEYTLDNYDMEFSTPLGVSNIMKKNSCNIKINEGSILIIKNI